MKNLLLAAILSTMPLTAVVFSQSAAASEAALAPQVDLQELKTLVAEKKAVIIDANSDAMYKEGHIPGAIHFASVEKKLAQSLPADKNALIVAYCGGPMCTAWEEAAKACKSLGYTNIKHFKGGIKGWKADGQKTEPAA